MEGLNKDKGLDWPGPESQETLSFGLFVTTLYKVESENPRASVVDNKARYKKQL